MHAINLFSATELIETSLKRRHRGYICVTGVHGIMEAQRDPVLHRILNQALLDLPDGMPTVWLSHLQGYSDTSRVFGPELMLNVCRSLISSRATHYLYGGDVHVPKQLQSALERACPGLQVIGTCSPPFRPLNAAEEADLKREISHKKPDIVWVGLSTPKQEYFMARMLPKLDCTLMIGVGAAFDFLTGRIKDCPPWVKTAGLQWSHRLLQEPKRLWRRYLLNNPRFVYEITLQLAGIKRYHFPVL